MDKVKGDQPYTGKGPAAGRRSGGRALALLLLVLACPALAESYEDRLEQANSHLRSGDATGALDLYRELQVDYPDEDRVIFGIGCAQYDQAAPLSARTTASMPGAQDEKEAPTAASLYDEAAATFDRLAVSRDPKLRVDAAFNRGNCAVSKAKFFADQGQRDEAVGAYRQAITIYEQLLKDSPEHAGALQNLDHARYELKLLLQQPPEKPPEQPKPVSMFIKPSTDIPGAKVIVPEDGPSELQLVTGAGESAS